MEKTIEQIPPNQGEGELDIEDQELQVEDLDFWTLSFLREHVEMPERIDFDPEQELEKIKKIVAESPKEGQSNQRVLLMASFKRRLKTLRENMAQAQLELERFIRENPETDQNNLLETAEEIANRNNVSTQASYFQKAVDSYFQTHTDIVDTVRDYKTRYPDTWQVELFQDLFGQPTHGQVKIEVMPINIYIKISDIEDYVMAASGLPDNIARNSGGAALINREFPKVNAVSRKVLIENVSLNYPEYSEKVVNPHEEEHSIHKNIYPRSAFIKGEQNWLRKIGSNRKIELSLFNTVIHDSITNILLENWLYQAKTEILAFMKNAKKIGDIKQILTDPDGLYNFQDNGKEHYQDWFLNHLKLSLIRVQKSDGHLLTKEGIRTMYLSSLEEAWHKRYLPVLNKAFQALEKMLNHYGSDKYPEIMRLLAQEPLNKWSRLARILS
ncbi:MAG: hypothetical protein Q8Q89_05150 [bacterium]|nr:hypothetical protein [bacterium]